LILKPWRDGNRSAYHSVTDLATLAHDGRRLRNELAFIATDDALRATPTDCASCGLPIRPDDDEPNFELRGNRGSFFPRTKTYRLRHYYCAWGVLLGPGGELEKLLNRRNGR
jgi:hypothetical protein